MSNIFRPWCEWQKIEMWCAISGVIRWSPAMSLWAEGSVGTGKPCHHGWSTTWRSMWETRQPSLQHDHSCDVRHLGARQGRCVLQRIGHLLNCQVSVPEANIVQSCENEWWSYYVCRATPERTSIPYRDSHPKHSWGRKHGGNDEQKYCSFLGALFVWDRRG